MENKAALIILYDHERKFLLQHRTKDAAVLPDYWAFFGGGIKEGETPEDAVHREAFEELNYKLISPLFFIEQDFKICSTEGHMYILKPLMVISQHLRCRKGRAGVGTKHQKLTA